MADISAAAKAELEIAPEDAEEFEKTLKENGWTVEGVKKAFLMAVSPSTENLPSTSNKTE